tara:strand:- start:20441 stop:21400 length:960 start_codon:yes stop_codon:yes gene_type:complete
MKFINNLKEFEILSPKSLFTKSFFLSKIKYWSRVLNRPNGWHYDLDIIWIIEKLNEYDIKPGDWILDAGAGQGLLQFILLAKGYNVISYDYSKRNILFRANKIFNIKNNVKDLDYSHKYMKRIKYSPNKKNSKSLINYFRRCGLKVFLKNIFIWLFNYCIYLSEIFFSNKKAYGKLIMYRGAFQDLSKLDIKVNAVVSLSAIEHCDKEEIKFCLDEMYKKLSKGPLIITTSIHDLKDDKYEDFFSSWTFGFDSLLNLFNIRVLKEDIEFARSEIKKNNLFWQRLDSYYFERKDSFFYKMKKNIIPYVPIGIVYFKDKEK